MEFLSWPNVIGGFPSCPISDWILALISPLAVLVIAKSEVRKFQLFDSRVGLYLESKEPFDP
jgi:hypothetical protein